MTNSTFATRRSARLAKLGAALGVATEPAEPTEPAESGDDGAKQIDGDQTDNKAVTSAASKKA